MWFSPQAFSHRDLCYFSAFVNVHTLDLQYPEIHRFMPGVEHYFRYFSQTLQSIILFSPQCTPRQLSHFLSLFSNLDNIEIWGWGTHTYLPVPTSDMQLVPFSAPKLRGRLILCDFRLVETWTYLITSCGLWFRHMDLRKSENCAPVLLEACAKTPEMLQVDATNGKLFYLD